MRTILGISAFYHDSAAALVVDGLPVAAAQEERFNRKKHFAGFPIKAVRYVLSERALSPREVDCIVFYDKPFRKIGRLISTFLAYAPKGMGTFGQAFSGWVSGKAFQKDSILKECRELGFRSECPLLFSSHHHSHAASAFFPSPFGESAILTMDGVGEWATTSIGVGRDSRIEILKEQRFPHSLGLLYSAFTDFTGFKVNSGEYKVMGLAPYGDAKYSQKILDYLIDLREDGSYRLNMEYFDYCTGDRMTNEAFWRLFDGPPRRSEDQITQREMDLAASIQAVTEEVVFRAAKHASHLTGAKKLCLAGGVALNCVANGKLRAKLIFDEIWVQPAAGDAGAALGAALYAYYHGGSRPCRKPTGKDAMRGGYLGPQFSNDEVRSQLNEIGAEFQCKDQSSVIQETAIALSRGKAVGWFQGRMEFGPRALGNRSILADPRSPDMQRVLNLKVKYRESFRPFAPSVLLEEVDRWFEYTGESPYMLMVANVLKDKCRQMSAREKALFGIDKLNIARSEVPAVTHVDYSARLQTVSRESNPLYHDLLSEFFKVTGCPILVNTSFNVRGEPIVCTPADAYRCFMGTELDLLVVENCMLWKADQPAHLKVDYRESFQLD